MPCQPFDPSQDVTDEPTRPETAVTCPGSGDPAEHAKWCALTHAPAE